MKVSRTIKINAVKEFNEGEKLTKLSEKYKVHQNTIRYWKSVFDDKGIDAFRIKGKINRYKNKVKNTYEESFKLEMVKKLLDGEKAVDIALENGVCSSNLSRWRTRYEDQLNKSELSISFDMTPFMNKTHKESGLKKTWKEQGADIIKREKKHLLNRLNQLNYLNKILNQV